MAGTYGVKETKEALLALVMIGSFVVERTRDGVQLDDAVALGEKLMLDGEFKTKVMAGIEGADKIPSEVGELDMADILEIAKGIPDLVAALPKKQEPAPAA